MMNVPVVTIDGTSGCGKGTLAHALARHFKWHYLDSGALYRIVAFAANLHHVALENTDELSEFILSRRIEFVDDNDLSAFKVLCDGEDVSQSIRLPECGKAASIVSAFPKVRSALLELQRSFLKSPGLVTDGRDMGTMVFPGASIKFFLTASLEQRALRRCQQLTDSGTVVALDHIQQELADRDERDQSRAIAPMIPAVEAHILDTSLMDIQQVFDLALSKIMVVI